MLTSFWPLMSLFARVFQQVHYGLDDLTVQHSRELEGYLDIPLLSLLLILCQNL